MNKLHRLSVNFLKYSPMVGAILMCIHVILLLFGINLYIAENLISLPIVPCIVALVWSKVFGFCKLHRFCICYISAVSYCINIQSDLFGFGMLLTPMRVLMGLIGLILTICIIIKQHELKTKSD